MPKKNQKKLRYESPKIFSFKEMDIGTGKACHGGSEAIGNCQYGTSASSSCTDGGFVESSCGHGFDAKTTCGGGTRPAGNCLTGEGVAP